MELQTLSSFFTLAHFFVLQLAQVAVAWTHIPGNTGHILVWFDNELYNPHSHGLDGKKLAIFQFDNPGNLQIWTDGTLALIPTDNCSNPNCLSSHYRIFQHLALAPSQPHNAQVLDPDN